MNHVVKNWHEAAFTAAKNLDVLKRVFAVVTFSGFVAVVLGPNKNSVARSGGFDCDVLSCRAADDELGFCEVFLVEVKNVDIAIFFVFA